MLELCCCHYCRSFWFFRVVGCCLCLLVGGWELGVKWHVSHCLLLVHQLLQAHLWAPCWQKMSCPAGRPPKKGTAPLPPSYWNHHTPMLQHPKWRPSIDRSTNKPVEGGGVYVFWQELERATSRRQQSINVNQVRDNSNDFHLFLLLPDTHHDKSTLTADKVDRPTNPAVTVCLEQHRTVKVGQVCPYRKTVFPRTLLTVLCSDGPLSKCHKCAMC